MNKFNKGMMSIALVSMIVVTTVGVSYSYFTTIINKPTFTSEISMKAGTMSLGYSNSPYIDIANVYPGSESIGEKTFSVTGKNTTDLQMHYNLYLVVSSTTFPSGSLSYELRGTNGDGVNTSGDLSPVANTDEKHGITTAQEYDLGIGYFDSNSDGTITHLYGIYFYLLETGKAQEGNGSKFSGYVTIKGVDETEYIEQDN